MASAYDLGVGDVIKGYGMDGSGLGVDKYNNVQRFSLG